MANESLEIALIKYNKKTWCKSCLLGFFIGLAVIVPGISGSTVAIIFKLYDQFLYAVGNLLRKFKRCFLFLLPIGIGMVIGILLGFVTVKQLLNILPFAVVCLFAGLMTGSFPAVKDELKGAERNAKRVALFAVGVLFPVALGCLSAVLTVRGSGGTSFTQQVYWWQIALGVVFGFVVGVTQVVPGLSASAFLMAVGWFGGLMDSVDPAIWGANPKIFVLYAALGIGFLLGIFVFSKLLTYLFGKARHTAYSAIVGLSLGSILSMFCNGDIIEVYCGWANGGAFALDVVLGICLFAAGVVGAYLLVRYQRKKDAEAAAEIAVENNE